MDSRNLRLLEVVGGRVVGWGSTALEPGLVKDGIVANPRALGAQLRGLMRASGIAPAPVAMSVAGVHSLTRIVALPGARAATEGELRAEAHRILTVPLEGLYLSWGLLGINQGGREYLLLGVPREVVDSRVAALRAAGLLPRALSSKSLALARVAGRRDAFLLNVDPGSLDVVVLAQGVPRVLHSVSFPEEGLSPEERAEAAARELSLVASFYHSRHSPPLSLSEAPLLLTGSLMVQDLFAQALRQEVDHAVAPLELPVECPPHLPLAPFATNLGLALSRLPPPSSPRGRALVPAINLMPQRRRPWHISPRQGAMALAFVAALMGLVGLFQVTSAAVERTSLVRRQRDLVDVRLQLIRQQNTLREGMKKELEEYQGLTSGRAVVSTYLQLLEEGKPPGLKLSGLTLSQKDIILQVDASCEEAEAYTEALRRTGRFATVSLPTVGQCQEEAGKLTFSIEAQFPPSGPQFIK